jgi:hypothetical protein
MKLLLLTVLATLALLATTTDTPAAEASGDPKPKGRGRLVHMVSFKFKDTASKDDIRKVEEAFAALPSKIPQIATFETGTNVSPENLNKGFTHGFLLTFRSTQDRDEYLVHPDHKAFAGSIGPAIADVFVIDFWTTKSGKAPKNDKPAKAEKTAK